MDMTATDDSIKIYISGHKETEYVQNEIFAPIQVGAALAKSKMSGFIQDDTGENISELNPRFCELTAQYWAWKNSKVEKIGFFHYRRYLSFNDQLKEQPDIWGSVIEPYLSESVVDKYSWHDDQIRKVVDQYDIILPEKRDIRLMPNCGKNAREQYLGSGMLHAADLEIMLDVLQEKYPDFVPYAQQYLNGVQTYLNNMFVMRRDIFEQYSEWLFDIVFECDRRIDYADYSTEAMRTPGHLAERLLNIYILYLQDHFNYRIKELPTVVFLETEPFKQLEPAFRKNNVAVVLSANDAYAPYLATTINSITEHADATNNYDILVMSKDMSARNQQRLIKLRQADNISLRFLNIARFESQFRKLFLRGHFTIETWFRLLLPDILQNYSKVLYLDADLVAETDVAELYQTDLNGYLLAACHDADTAGLYNGFEPSKKPYMDTILKLQNPYDYFQAGVILFNLDEFRKQFTVQEMLEYAGSYDFQLLDQDVLNKLAEGQVKYVDMAWNVMYDWLGKRRREIIAHAPRRLQKAYDAAHDAPKIIHYAGPDKPWDDPKVDYAESFWRYCRNSGYYEETIYNAFARRNTGKPSLIKQGCKKVARLALPNKTRRGRLARSFYEKLRRR